MSRGQVLGSWEQPLGLELPRGQGWARGDRTWGQGPDLVGERVTRRARMRAVVTSRRVRGRGLSVGISEEFSPRLGS